MTKILLERGAFIDHPFVLLDVGCSGGLHPLWRVFGDQLVAHGFDPQRSECRRLQEQEVTPRVYYHCYFVGLPEEHEFCQRRAREQAQESEYYNPWPRLSSTYGAQVAPRLASQANSIGVELTTQRISLTQFAQQWGLDNVDFIKIDTDGFDLESAISSQELIRRFDILGYLMEVNFAGSSLSTANNYANIDKFMKANGLAMFDMTINRYSRRDLPARFESKILAQTVSGQPVWGDLLYAQDAGSPNYEQIWGKPLPWHKVLKLACLLEMFSLPDCAAEVINRHAEQLARFMNPDLLLDALTPSLVKPDGKRVTYQEYVQYFREDPSRFFPN